ncbi:MAG TPA: hypothetical protein VI636_18850 [Candidatus Angelobacter sp.]
MQARYSASIRGLPWNVVLGIVTIRGVESGSLQMAVDSLGRAVLRQAEGNHPDLTRRMKAFESFFAANNLRSPLAGQFEAMRSRGTPGGSPLVQALLLLEMNTGLLMGAQDAGAIKGELLCDLAAEGEIFRGMRTEVQCRKDEILLRDSEGIIAALLQGPDYRTRLKNSTKDLVFFVFSVPGITLHEAQDGVQAVRNLFKDACAEIQAQVYQSSDSV